MDKKITVDKNKCIHCGQCLKDCIMGCLEFSDEKIPQYKENAIDNCISCQHCMAVCPKGALSFCDKNPDNSSKTSYGNSNELLNLIKSRRSIRQYKNENIPKETFDKIKYMLSFAPTGVNIDSLHFSIVETKEKMQEIIEKTKEKLLNSNSDSPYIQMSKQFYEQGIDLVYRGATSMIAVSVDRQKAAQGCVDVDPIISLSYLDLYAQSLGLGTVWCGIATGVLNEFKEVYSILEIPENYTLNYVMLLGIPNVKYQRTIQPDKISVNELR